MLHSRFKLIHNPATIVIDRPPPEESDIDEDDHAGSNAALKALENSKKQGGNSLLSSVNLKGRR
jgi:hypothetical protein